MELPAACRTVVVPARRYHDAALCCQQHEQRQNRHGDALPAKATATADTEMQQQHRIPQFPQQATNKTMLTRDFIRASLYSSRGGYFVQREVIYSPQRRIEFPSLLGKLEYQHQLAQLYAASPHAWLTPVEIFAPWYSYALANYMLREWKRATGGSSRQPLIVYEVGGGSGTNARHVLDYLRTHAPQTYRHASYTILEISPTLSEKQTLALADHAAVARSVVMDATRADESGLRDARPCFVMALEVLDNLPHDKIVAFGDPTAPTWCETHVEALDDSELLPLADSDAGSEQKNGLSLAALPPLREIYRPVEDTTILQTMPYCFPGMAMPDGGAQRPTCLTSPPPAKSAAAGLWARAQSVIADKLQRLKRSSVLPPLPDGEFVEAHYLPTGSMQLLTSLRKALPAHRLLLADFCELPPPLLDPARLSNDRRVAAYAPGSGAPLVASKDASTRACRILVALHCLLAVSCSSACLVASGR